jgi:NAD(P)-dependent dehydrogenase (short-subunit alcohol dehydrogenase family)
MYGATKAGMQHLVLTWAKEVAKTSLRVNCADPGTVATRLHAQAYPGIDPRTLKQPAEVAPALAALCLPAETRHGTLIRVG